MSLPDLKFQVRAVDQFSSVFGKLGSSLNTLSGTVDSTGSRFSNLGSTVKTAAGFLLGNLAHDALGAVTSAGRESSETFVEYEQTLTKIISATNAYGEEAKELKTELAKVAESQASLGFSAREASKGLESLVKAGMTGEQAAQALKAALSLARLESISTDIASNLLVQTLTMFHKAADESAEALDSLSRAADAGIGTATDYASGLANCGASAANMGISLEETLAALVQLDKTFGSAVESGTYLNSMFKDLIAKAGDLGLSLYNADGSMRSLDDIVGQLRANVAEFGDNQEAVNEYLSVFDIRAQRAVVGLLNYEGSIADTMGQMEEARSVQDKLNLTLDTTAGQMAKLNAEQENVSYQLGQMTSQMQLTWKQFALGLGPIGAVADSLGPALLQGAITGLMVMLPTIIAGIGGLSGVMTALGVAVHFALGPIGLVIAAITALGIAYATNFMGFQDVVNGAVQAIIGNLGELAKAFWNAVHWVQDALGSFGESVSNAFSGAWDAITNFISGICFAHAIDNAVESSRKDLNVWVDAVGSSMKSALGEIKDFNADLERAEFSRSIAVQGGLPVAPETVRGGGGPVEINIDVHDNDIASEVDKVELAEDVSWKMIEKLQALGIRMD